MGVHAVFTPGANIKSIVDAVRQAAAEAGRA
jgi:methylmalonyl-CoA mutase cobalamin-binding subunit